MATITIDFEFSNGESDSHEFDATGGLVADITSYRDDRLEELNEDREEDDEEIECEGYEVSDTDLDHACQEDWTAFDDLDEFADYCDLVDQYGEAYCLRRDDCGDGFDFDDEYNGCWSSFEEFAENFFDDCMECPDSLKSYIDYEKFASELSYDYTEYEGYEGVHVFRS